MITNIHAYIEDGKKVFEEILSASGWAPAQNIFWNGDFEVLIIDWVKYSKLTLEPGYRHVFNYDIDLHRKSYATLAI